MKLRYACIGIGGIAGKKHLKQYAMVESIEMVAVCDVDSEKAKQAASKFGIAKVYSDYQELFRQERLDLASICTPNNLHATMVKAALEAGIHVHCEKPLALNPKEIEAIIEAKNCTEKKVLVGLNKRFTPETEYIKRCIDADFLGEIYHSQCGWRRRAGIPGRGSWFTDKQKSGGGALIDLGVHMMDLTMYLMDYPIPIAVDGSAYQKFNESHTRDRNGYNGSKEGVFDVEDMAVGHVRLDNGCTLSYEFSWASNIKKESFYYELKGTKGGVTFIDNQLEIYTELNGVCVDVIPRLNERVASIGECEHFVECIVHDLEPRATAEQAYELSKIIDGAYTSSTIGRQVKL